MKSDRNLCVYFFFLVLVCVSSQRRICLSKNVMLKNTYAVKENIINEL